MCRCTHKRKQVQIGEYIVNSFVRTYCMPVTVSHLLSETQHIDGGWWVNIVVHCAAYTYGTIYVTQNPTAYEIYSGLPLNEKQSKSFLCHLNLVRTRRFLSN